MLLTLASVTLVVELRKVDSADVLFSRTTRVVAFIRIRCRFPRLEQNFCGDLDFCSYLEGGRYGARTSVLSETALNKKL